MLMGNAEIKAVHEILSNKKKFRRTIIIILIICATLISIAGIGFYTGAITYHKTSGGNTRNE
jgi:flagellar basal body-associated protein FliL